MTSKEINNETDSKIDDKNSDGIDNKIDDKNNNSDITNTNIKVENNENKEIQEKDLKVEEILELSDNEDIIPKRNKISKKRNFTQFNNHDNNNTNSIQKNILVIDVQRFMKEFDGRQYVSVCDIIPVNGVTSAIIYKGDEIEFQNFSILCTKYFIKDNIYHIEEYKLHGGKKKKKKLNPKLEKVNITTPTKKKSKSKIKKNKSKKSKTQNHVFYGYFLGFTAQRKLSDDKKGYYSDCLFIDRNSKRFRFRAFSKEFNRLKHILIPLKLYKIKNFLVFNSDINLNTITVSTKFIDNGEQLTNQQFYNFLTLKDINQILKKDINTKQRYDIIGKIMEINHKENIEKLEVTITNGIDSINVNIWKENIDYYIEHIKHGDVLIILSGFINVDRQKNVISNYYHIISANRFRKIDPNQIEPYYNINIKQIYDKLTNNIIKLVTKEGNYDAFRRSRISQIHSIDWDDIRVKHLPNTNIPKYTFQGLEDKSLAVIIVGSIIAIPNAGKYGMVYPVEKNDDELGNKKVRLNHDNKWYLYKNNNEIKPVQDK